MSSEGESGGFPGWLGTALTTVIGSMITGILTYLGVRRSSKTKEVEVAGSTTVELRRIDVEADKAVFAAYQQQLTDYRAFFDGMKGRITQLETDRDERGKMITLLRDELEKLRQAQATCDTNREHEVRALKERIAELERKNGR